jgi:hypothetical protein
MFGSVEVPDTGYWGDIDHGADHNGWKVFKVTTKVRITPGLISLKTAFPGKDANIRRQCSAASVHEGQESPLMQQSS